VTIPEAAYIQLQRRLPEDEQGKARKSSLLTGAQDTHLQRVTIPEAANIQVRRRPPEYEQSNARNM